MGMRKYWKNKVNARALHINRMVTWASWSFSIDIFSRSQYEWGQMREHKHRCWLHLNFSISESGSNISTWYCTHQVNQVIRCSTARKALSFLCGQQVSYLYRGHPSVSCGTYFRFELLTMFGDNRALFKVHFKAAITVVNAEVSLHSCVNMTTMLLSNASSSSVCLSVRHTPYRESVRSHKQCPLHMPLRTLTEHWLIFRSREHNLAVCCVTYLFQAMWSATQLGEHNNLLVIAGSIAYCRLTYLFNDPKHYFCYRHQYEFRKPCSCQTMVSSMKLHFKERLQNFLRALVKQCPILPAFTGVYCVLLSVLVYFGLCKYVEALYYF